MAEARLLTRAMLQAMLGGMAWSQISTRMERGQLPKPLWGVKPSDKSARWDARAVNQALDRASAIPNSVEADTAELDRSFGHV